MQPNPTSGTTSGRVAANVRGILAARQIKRADFIEALGWSAGTASRRLNGGTWDIDEVDVAADFLGVAVTDLTRNEAAA